MGTAAGDAIHCEPWNKGKLVGQWAPFKLKDIWALRVQVQMEGHVRKQALYNHHIDSQLCGFGLVGPKVRDACHGEQVASRAIVVQHMAQHPVQLEITPAAREAVQPWIKFAGLKPQGFLFPSRLHDAPHLGTHRYTRILGRSKLASTASYLGIEVDDALEVSGQAAI